jgi:hypothetical protein
MNWRLGLFRLWIVGTVLFVIAVAFVSYSEIKTQFDGADIKNNPFADLMRLPVFCKDVRGVAGADYTTKKGQDPGPWDEYAKPNPFDECWYPMSTFRPLYPEYNDLSDNELKRRLYIAHGLHPNPWTTLGMWASIAFGIPLVVLILGSSLVWAFSGFAATRPQRAGG